MVLMQLRAQEWTSGKRGILPKPAYSKAIMDRHAERVKATKDRVNLKLSSLQQESLAMTKKLKWRQMIASS
jgi:hypothetical protein